MKKQSLECGCALCNKCGGAGYLHEKDSDGWYVTCDLCEGDAKVKLCRTHAEKSGWLDDKPERKRPV